MSAIARTSPRNAAGKAGIKVGVLNSLSGTMAEQLLDFASGLADEYCVLDGGVVVLSSSAASLDCAAVHELLAV